MKKMNWKNYLLVVSIAICVTSCGDDEQTPKGAFENGVLVVNEGNFLSANASITHFDKSTKNVTDNIYFSSNTSTSLGDVAQSAYVNNDVAFVVVNNSNKVEVANANTFTKLATIDAMLPRFFTVSQGKGYLTEWVSFSDPGRVSVIDLSDYSVETTITTGFGAENIIATNDKLFVSNNFEGTVSVIDPTLNEVTATLNVGSAPGGFVLDSERNLWLICGGGRDQDFNPLNDGAFYKINTTSNTFASIDLSANIPIKIAINKARDIIYYFSGNQVFKLSTSATSKPSEAFITEASAIGFYGIGVDSDTDILYVGDSKGFQANGEVFRYNADGSAIDSFKSGIGPNAFVFK